MILINCLAAITGKVILTNTEGQKESNLLARAISKAPALNGCGNIFFKRDRLKAALGCTESVPVGSTLPFNFSDGKGDEKESRYKAIKKSSLRAQQRNKTSCKA